MVAYNNSFEGGIEGADFTSGNSGGASGDAATSVSVGVNGTMTYAGLSAMHGTMGLAMTTTATTVAMYFEYNVVASDRYVWRSYIRLSAQPTIRTVIGRMRSAGATITTVASLMVNAVNCIGVFDSTGAEIVAAAGVVALSASTVYRVEWAVNGITGETEWRLFAGDSTTVLDSKAVTGQAFGAVQIGKIRVGRVVGSGFIGTISFDDILLQDLATGFVGPVSNATTTVRPTSVVSNPGVFTNVGGASSLFAALADESDVTYIQSPANPSGTTITVVASPVIGVTYDLMMLATVISTRTIAVLPTTITDYSWTATSGETAAITDRTQLRVRIVTSV
jgi:hypothetical protein